MASAAPANINHIAVVLDESYSMRPHAASVVKVTDNVVAHLAERSRYYDQETRATVYTFSERGGERCLYYDKDVLRLPSIAGRYQPRSQTALIDATLLAVRDLQHSAQLYGNHAFLVYVLSDGVENASAARPHQLAAEVAGLPGNWTLAAFAPDQQAVFELKQAGFPAENITVWDTTSAAGLEHAGEIIRQSSENFMQGRERGVHGYNKPGAGGGLFRVREFTASEVTSQLPPLTKGSYTFYDVTEDRRIDEFTAEATKKPYVVGHSYYQFTKREEIQASKQVVVEVGGQVYAGRAARDILGLPDATTRVSPNVKAGAVIFVQSTSPNRKLLAGTRLLVLR